MKPSSWLIFILAALLEVSGDAVIRLGFRGKGLPAIAAGMLLLGVYGLLVNGIDPLKIDFSRLIGMYVAVFATLSVLWSRVVFRENMAGSTWLGLALIIFGSAVIQFGGSR